MRTCCIAIMLCLTPLSFAADGVADVRAVLDDQVACWNQGDLEGYMKGYWNDDKLTFYSGGTVTKGWKPVLERYRKSYKAEGKEMGKLAFADVEVEMAGEANAIVRGKWKLVNSKETVEGLFTLQVKKLAEGWKVVHDHTSK
jgi:ketosteroid isomerase-like protein